MPKFFVDKQYIKDKEITLVGENVNHIKNVLRLHIGDEILINDRQGQDYECIIKDINSYSILCAVKETARSQTEPRVQTCLFQALIKGEKMDLVIQKCVEIGVSMIIPLCTERCVVKVDDDKKVQSKVQRWNKIAESAAKQSGRGIIPEVHKPLSFFQAVAYANENLNKSCIPYEKEESKKLKDFLSTCHQGSIGIFIGPEGGFSKEEIELATSNNIESVSLGKRILRSETAGIVVLSNIMYEMGEM